jgi:phosphoribosyl 1,2-cyclic phosphate phosphodiesterase
VRVTFLGTGTSHGVPAIGCDCPVCTSPDPRNHRARCAIIVRQASRTVLIDTPPELRQQAIRFHVPRLDAVLFTHSHADHIFGLDDIRRFNDLQQRDMPCYGSHATLEDIRRAFQYVFVETQAGGGKPRLLLNEIEPGPFTITRPDGEASSLPASGPPTPSDQWRAWVPWAGGGVQPITVEAIPILHGRLPVYAYRFGRFAYVTDVSEIPLESRERLRGLDTLVLGALRQDPHPTHFSIGQALEVVAELRPRRAFFTHLAHNVEHRTTEVGFPPGVRLAYDGLVLDIEDETPIAL